MGLGRTFTRSAATGYPHAGPPFGGFNPYLGSLENLLESTGGKPWEVSGQSEMFIYRGLMSIPAAWRAAILLSDMLGSVPWDAYTSHGRDQLEMISPRPPLLEQPAPPDTKMTTISSGALDLIADGNAVSIIASRNAGGQPTAVYPVPARWCGVRRINQMNNAFSPLPIGAIEYSVAGQTFSSDEVIHVKGPTAPGALRGFGVLEAHWRTLRLSHEQLAQAESVSKHGVPTGLLKVTNPDATQGDMMAAKDGWLRNQRDRTIQVVNATTDFTPLSWNPDEMQLLQSRQFSLLEWANIFGLPPKYLGAPTGSSMTYATSESEAQDLLKFSLRGHLARFEETYSLAFPRGTVVKADLDAFLRSDTLQRYQAYETGIRAGWLQRSEVRCKEDLPVIPGIDKQPETTAVQTVMNKDEPVTEPGFTQPKVPAAGPIPPAAQPPTIPPLNGKKVPA